MPWLALAGYALFLTLAFGLRSLVHHRRTGTTGFVGLSGRPGSIEWLGGVLFGVALVAGIAAPCLQLGGLVPPWTALESPGVRAVGVVLYVVGVAATVWAQFAMGDAWRIGVRQTETTALVSHGPFRWVRNPIYSSMLAATVGLVLVVPNVMSALALVALVVGLELHVRWVEEPYLTRTHGPAYRDYAARTGRFVPGCGRL
jgi:protein-S-isoprenylcysteine O-methyltransferase Ste14